MTITITAPDEISELIQQRVESASENTETTELAEGLKNFIGSNPNTFFVDFFMGENSVRTIAMGGNDSLVKGRQCKV